MLRAMPEAPQMDSSWSLDSFTTNFFEKLYKSIPLGLQIVLPPIFLKIVQELTENATIDGWGGMVGGEIGISFQLPIIIPLPQRVG